MAGGGTQLHKDDEVNTTPFLFSARKTLLSQNTLLTLGVIPLAQFTTQLAPSSKLEVLFAQTFPHPSELLVFEGFPATSPKTHSPKRNRGKIFTTCRKGTETAKTHDMLH